MASALRQIGATPQPQFNELAKIHYESGREHPFPAAAGERLMVSRLGRFLSVVSLKYLEKMIGTS